MACLSDPIYTRTPDKAQREMNKVSTLLIYVRTALGLHVEKLLISLASEEFPSTFNLDIVTARLCNLLRNLTEEQANAIIWDGRKAEARELAEWWEKHQEFDRQRLIAEQRIKLDARIKKNALAKLTAEEKRVLGLTDSE